MHFEKKPSSKTSNQNSVNLWQESCMSFKGTQYTFSSWGWFKDIIWKQDYDSAVHLKHIHNANPSIKWQHWLRPSSINFSLETAEKVPRKSEVRKSEVLSSYVHFAERALHFVFRGGKPRNNLHSWQPLQELGSNWLHPKIQLSA